jgi:hypothetical protein
MEKYYSISHENSGKTPYAPTIISNNNVYLSDCSGCGKSRFNHSNRDITLLIEGEGKLPDYLLCGHYPLIILSDKVLKAWDKSNITGYESFPVKLIDDHHRKISKESPYHNIIITGRAELDLYEMDINVTSICEVCGSVEYNKQIWEFGKSIMKEKSYDGKDLFTFKYFEAAPICTLKVLATAYENKLSNFRFQDYETMFMYIGPNQSINLKEMFK